MVDSEEMDKNLPLLTILVGIQGSGKSTWAGNQDDFDGLLLSSDALRSEYPNWGNDEIFKEIYKRANEALSKGIDVIIDSTAITIKSRKKMLNAINVPCIKKALIFNTPYEECKRRLIQRNAINGKTGSHYVPLEVQRKYLESFEIPFLEEGFDYINVYNKPSLMESNANLLYMDEKTSGFNQNNKHHSQLLNEHMSSTYFYVREHSKDMPLLIASMYHDIGKVFTQTYKEGDPNAHYYNHANVGAYWFLSNVGVYMLGKGLFDKGQLDTYLTQTTLDTVFYINYHMVMYNLKTEKSINKWKNIFGEQKFTNLQLLNKADVFYHLNKMKESKKMIDLDLVSLSGMMSDILNRKDVDMEKFERLKTKMYSKLSIENDCKEDTPWSSIDKTSLKDEKINHNEDNFIAIEGICRECGYPVICEDDYCMSNNAGFDFHIYCSNPKCTHHKGYEVNDTDIDDDQLPFIEFSKEALIKDNILK